MSGELAKLLVKLKLLFNIIISEEFALQLVQFILHMFPCYSDSPYRYFSDCRQKMNKSREFLSRRLECQYGLMDLLMSKGVLLDYQLDNIQELQSNRSEQNDKLIEMLCLQKGCQPYLNFLSALTQTNQSHLAKYITCGEGMVWIILCFTLYCL